MELVVTDIPGLLIGHSYTFTIVDTAHDGICCAYGEGRAKVPAVQDNGSVGAPLWESNGSFGGLAQATVVLL